MDLFTRNYWSLYLDFLDQFESLQFKGYSLPYLCHFRSLIKNNTQLMRELENDSIQKKLVNQVTKEKDIQNKFNRFINKHRSKNMNPPKDGKIVLFDIYNLLRFPNETLLKHFKPNETLLFDEKIKNRPQKKLAIPTHDFADYSNNSTTLNNQMKSVQKKANKIYAQNKEHFMIGDKYFQRVFMMQITKIMNRIIEVEQLFEREKIKAVIVPSTHYPECRTLVMIAQEKGIPTICMQHGIISGEHGYLPKIAQIDAVYGSFEVEWFKRKGVDESLLEKVGHPRFDQIFLRKKQSKAHFEKKVRLNPKKKTILVGVRGEQNIDQWREFLRILTNDNSFNLILRDFPNVKHHPLINEFPNLFTAESFHLYDIIHNVDAVVVYSSTIALEAMLAGKPAFILNERFPGYTGYFDSLDKIAQKHPLTLAIKVKQYFTDTSFNKYVNQKREEFLTNAYDQRNVLSINRLLKLIERLTKENES